LVRATDIPQNRPLQRLFNEVPHRYDLINRIATWGLDQRWRRLAARQCLVGNPQRLLDLACGTGDLTIRLAGMTNNSTEIIGIDFSLPMLRVARGKADGSAVSFIYGDVASMPFASDYFDCIGISFAFRNLTYRNPLALRYLSEVLRVLRPGGRFVIVESSQPQPAPVRRLFHLYLRRFVFPMGYALSGNRGAYRYLAESAARYYTPEDLRELLLNAGFHQFTTRKLLLGAIAIHTATK
jgi:demethylmenaquinone methyltransferase/2-methoxy-6-polyprenyl-1,4-benzoquinol methylase